MRLTLAGHAPSLYNLFSANLVSMRWAIRRFDHLFGMFRTEAGAVRRLDVILATYEERAFCILGCVSQALQGAPPENCC